MSPHSFASPHFTILRMMPLATCLFLTALPKLHAAPAGERAEVCKVLLADQNTFVRVAEEFLHTNKTNLSDVMRSEQNRQAFFSQADVQNFLTRPASALRWGADHPILTDPTVPSVLEPQIYKLAENLIPYRNNHDRAEFYRTGTPRPAVPFLAEILRRRHPDIFVAKPLDIYEVRHFVNKLTRPEAYLNNYGPGAGAALESASRARLLVFPMAKDFHMASIVVIFDPAHRRPLAALWINTKKSEDSFRYYAHRWNMSDSYRYSISDERSGGLANLPFVVDGGKAGANEALKTIDYVEDYEFVDEIRAKRLVMNRPIPLIDVSHPLQSEADDFNCALYTFNFLDAVGSLVHDKLNSIFALAENVADREDHAEAATELVRIFENGAKPYLPQYYTALGESRSAEEIKRYHLHFRWDIGSEYIRELARPGGSVHAEDRRDTYGRRR